MKLKKGDKYDPTNLKLLYWRNGSKVITDTEAYGYSLYSYFDDGRYLGPDKYGVEPEVERIEEEAPQ